MASSARPVACRSGRESARFRCPLRNDGAARGTGTALASSTAFRNPTRRPLPSKASASPRRRCSSAGAG
eukprot:924078-Pyramimonas_sp.AAC.1